MLPIALDRASREPLYRQIEVQIRDSILDGRLPPGIRVPGIRTFAKQLGVARITVSTAYDDLAAAGYLIARTGAGTRVVEPLPVDDLWVPPPTRPALHLPNAGTSAADQDHASLPGSLSVVPIQQDFTPGAVAFDLFPIKTWGKLLQRAWREISTDPTQGHPAGFGDPCLRLAISRFVGPWRGVRCQPGNVVILSSVAAAFAALARAFLPEAGICALEDPGYPEFMRSLRGRGSTLVPVAVDDHGLNPAGLPRQADVLLVGPAWQYPLGGTMPIDRRRRTLEWARETGCIVVEHDWAGLVRYQGSTLPALQAHDVSDQVIYLGSFVEAVPAARMAYAIVPDPLMSRFRSVLGPLEAWPSPVEQRALAHFLDDGHLERHLRRLRVALWDRQVEVIEMLNHRIGQRISIRPAAAGGHVVIRLADDVVEGMRGVAARSAERGLLVSALADHALGATTDDALLFSFASHREVDLSRAMNVLARAIDDSAGASQPMSRLAWSGIRIR